MTKVCSKCKEHKLLGEFHRSHLRKNSDGRQHRCKTCCRLFTQVATKRWRLENPDVVHLSGLRTKAKLKYGLTLDEIHRILSLQNGVCAICQRSINFDAADKRDKPHVDHDHETGMVRGLLCLTCNTGLGMLGDSVELLSAAKAYILHPIVQAERLSELAPYNEDDATVCSHGNNNHERLAEMTSPTIN